MTRRLRPNSTSAMSQGGFTLLEVCVALAILTVGMIGVIQMYFFGLDKLRTVNEAAIARTLVQNEIEYLRALPFSELKNGYFESFTSQSLKDAGLLNAVGSVSVRDVPGFEGRLKEVQVALRWTGEYGRVIEQQATTLIAEKGGAARDGTRAPQ